MRFLRQYQYALCFLAVTFLALVMVFRELQADQSAHIERREDFLLLSEQGRKGPAEHCYQNLIQEFSSLSDRNLASDLERTAMVLNSRTNAVEDLVWKYHISVRNELRHRAERRVARFTSEASP